MDRFQPILDHLGDPAYLAHHYGTLFYFITFLWTAIEGESFVIIAGLLAQKGYLNIAALFMAAWLGSFAGDQIVFFLGRRYGKRILDHFPKIEPAVERAIGWLERYAVVFILSYRFIYGVRNVSGVAIGMSHLPWKKFAIWNCAAALVWAIAFIGFGYLFGDVIAHMHHKEEVVSYSVREMMLTVLGLFACIILMKLVVLRCHRSVKAKDKTPKA
jgi:membrane protein DedA with SNARE-associated domain